MIALLAAVMTAWGCGQKAAAPKVLVLFYSQTSNTKTVAEAIAARLGADIEEIIAEPPFDGTYQETIERCLQERENGTVCGIQPIRSSIPDYDIIFIGYPVWFGTFAPPISALLDQIDLSGKKVVPFCTFGSGGLNSSSRDLVARIPDAEVLPGYGVRAARLDAVPAEIDRFLKEGGFMEGEVTPLEDFPAPHEVSEEEAAIFDAAVEGYRMLNAKATQAASRPIPDGTEYLFTAVDLPREGGPGFQGAPREMQVYVLVETGKAPVFTQVVR